MDDGGAKLSVTTRGFSKSTSRDLGGSAGVCITSLDLSGVALPGKKNQIPDRTGQDKTGRTGWDRMGQFS